MPSNCQLMQLVFYTKCQPNNSFLRTNSLQELIKVNPN